MLAVRISVACRFRDGNLQLVDDQYVDLREAVAAALDLADRHRNDPGDGHGPPKSFDVACNDALLLSVAVIRGGLMPAANPR